MYPKDVGKNVHVIQAFPIRYRHLYPSFRIYCLAFRFGTQHLFCATIYERNPMKYFIISLSLFLSACVNNGTNLETMCLHKDPNAMTDREVDMCKAYLQRPVIYQN